MTENNDLFRKLHDLGVFLIGLAAIITCVYFVFLREDPYRDMKKAMTQSFVDGMKKGHLEENK